MSARAEQTPLLMRQCHVATANGAEEHESSVADGGTGAPVVTGHSGQGYSAARTGPHPECQRVPPNIARAVRVRLRIMDSKETRGTSMSLRSSAPRSKRCAALGMRAVARSKAPAEAVRMPAIAR